MRIRLSRGVNPSSREGESQTGDWMAVSFDSLALCDGCCGSPGL